MVEAICQALDQLLPAGAPYSHPDQQRAGLGTRHSLDEGLVATDLNVWLAPGEFRSRF